MQNTNKILILSAVFIASSSHKVDAFPLRGWFSEDTTRKSLGSPRLTEVRTEKRGKNRIIWEEFSTGSIRMTTLRPGYYRSSQDIHHNGEVSTHTTYTTSFLKQMLEMKTSVRKQQVCEENVGPSFPIRKWKLFSLHPLKNLELGKPKTLSFDFTEFDDGDFSSMSSTATSASSGQWETQEAYLADVYAPNAQKEKNEKSKREKIRKGKQKVTDSDEEII